MASLLEELKQELETWIPNDDYCSENGKLGDLRREMEAVRREYVSLQEEYSKATTRICDLRAAIACLEER